MKTLDPGHRYLVDSYDGGKPFEITFMKREGKGYPGNVGHHSGTNCQELLRVLIDRIMYLNRQIAHKNNVASLRKLREVLWLFEDRAAERHGVGFDYYPAEIDTVPHCIVCGHVVCKGHYETRQKSKSKRNGKVRAHKAAR